MIEMVFATFYSCIHKMMAHLRLHENFKTGIWPECAVTSTKLGNILVNPHEEKCAHNKSCGKIMDYAKQLRNFGG